MLASVRPLISHKSFRFIAMSTWHVFVVDTPINFGIDTYHLWNDRYTTRLTILVEKFHWRSMVKRIFLYMIFDIKRKHIFYWKRNKTHKYAKLISKSTLTTTTTMIEKRINAARKKQISHWSNEKNAWCWCFIKSLSLFIWSGKPLCWIDPSRLQPHLLKTNNDGGIEMEC